MSDPGIAQPDDPPPGGGVSDPAHAVRHNHGAGGLIVRSIALVVASVYGLLIGFAWLAGRNVEGNSGTPANEYLSGWITTLGWFMVPAAFVLGLIVRGHPWRVALSLTWPLVLGGALVTLAGCPIAPPCGRYELAPLLAGLTLPAIVVALCAVAASPAAVWRSTQLAYATLWSHQGAPPIQRGAPLIHQDAAAIHQDAPPIHQDAPPIQGNVTGVRRLKMVGFTVLAVLGTVSVIVGFVWGIGKDPAAQRVGSVLMGAGWVLLGGAAIFVGMAAVREVQAWLRAYLLKGRQERRVALVGLGVGLLMLLISFLVFFPGIITFR